MDSNYIINKIHNVYEGEFNPGLLDRKMAGRPFDAFVYFIYGDVDYFFEGYSFNANPQNFICLTKGSTYDIKINKKSKFICVDFDFCGGSPKRKSEIYKVNFSVSKQKFSKIFYLWKQKMNGSAPESFSLLYELYSDAVKITAKKYAKQKDFLSDITSYILSHYCEKDFSIKDIANYGRISETHLRRVFKEAFNVSPIKYVNYLKLDKAKNMLQISNYTINEIALSVGFDDSYYFSRFFSRETGLSPSEYRKSNNGF